MDRSAVEGPLLKERRSSALLVTSMFMFDLCVSSTGSKSCFVPGLANPVQILIKVNERVNNTIWIGVLL